MSTNIFWGLLILDTIALVILACLAMRGPSSPEGPVGAWIIFIPPLIMILLAVLVFLTKSPRIVTAGIYILGMPWFSLVAGPIQSAIQNYQTDRRISGFSDFRGPARELVKAITARDAARVQEWIPRVGDLNRQHGEDTFLHFAVSNARDTSQSPAVVPPASLEIIQLLLHAGANADQADANDRRPLSAALYAGPEVTELLLKAGANPNHLDGASRPLWWQILSDDTPQGHRTLAILLDNGADLTIRDGEGSAVGWAAYHADHHYNSTWQAVWLLVDRGAPWKDEQQFGQPVAAMLARDYARREQNGRDISDAMRHLRARYASECN